MRQNNGSFYFCTFYLSHTVKLYVVQSFLFPLTLLEEAYIVFHLTIYCDVAMAQFLHPPVYQHQHQNLGRAREKLRGKKSENCAQSAQKCVIFMSTNLAHFNTFAIMEGGTFGGVKKYVGGKCSLWRRHCCSVYKIMNACHTQTMSLFNMNFLTFSPF